MFEIRAFNLCAPSRPDPSRAVTLHRRTVIWERHGSLKSIVHLYKNNVLNCRKLSEFPKLALFFDSPSTHLLPIFISLRNLNKNTNIHIKIYVYSIFIRLCNCIKIKNMYPSNSKKKYKNFYSFLSDFVQKNSLLNSNLHRIGLSTSFSSLILTVLTQIVRESNDDSNKKSRLKMIH